jgi:guanylate kinase
VILEIDVQGALQVMEKLPAPVSIFIMPPSFDVLKARLTSRATENNENLELRLRNSHDEIKQYEKFDYIVVNDQVAAAVRKLMSIILAERQHRDRQREAVQGILDSFGSSTP